MYPGVGQKHYVDGSTILFNIPPDGVGSQLWREIRRGIAVIILPFPLSPSPGQFYTTQSVCVACLGGGREGRRWVEEPYAIVIHVQAAAARLLTPTE